MPLVSRLSSLRRIRRPWVRGLAGLLLVGFCATPVAATDPSYLREMPAPATVLADYRTADPMETRARQTAALRRLYAVLRELAGPRFSTGDFPNAAEKPIVAAYIAEANRIRNEGIATFPPGPASMDSPGAKWKLSIERLEQNASFRDELMRRYFSPEFQARHRAAIGDFRARADAGRDAIARGLRDLDPTPETVWERMTPDDQDRALTFGALMCALLALGALRELLPFRVARSGSPALRTGFGRPRLDWNTGVVTDYQAREHSITSFWERRFPNGRVEVFNTTTTTRHEEFDLVNSAGRHHVHTTFTTDGTPCPNEFEAWIGRSVTAVSARRGWFRKSRPILFRDPEGGADIPARAARHHLDRLIAPRLWTIWPAMGLGYIVGSVTSMGLGHMVSSGVRGLAGVPIAIVCWGIVVFAVSTLRQRRFERDELPRLRALVATPR